jgi:hypothetical protein
VKKEEVMQALIYRQVLPNGLELITGVVVVLLLLPLVHHHLQGLLQDADWPDLKVKKVNVLFSPFWPTQSCVTTPSL